MFINRYTVKYTAKNHKIIITLEFVNILKITSVSIFDLVVGVVVVGDVVVGDGDDEDADVFPLVFGDVDIEADVFDGDGEVVGLLIFYNRL